MRLYYKLIFLCFFYQAAFGQESKPVVFSQLNTNNSLSQGPISCILKDKHGFMWFGTEDGLNKYDGYKFKLFRNTPGDLKSISSNNIKCLYEDKAGDLWVGTLGGGVVKYNRSDDSFVSYEKSVILSLFESSDSTFWVGTLTGLKILDRKTQKIVSAAVLNEQFSKVNESIFCIYEDHHKNIWIGAENKLLIYYPKTGKIQQISFYDQASDPEKQCWVSSIVEDQSGNCLVGTDDGLHIFNYSDYNTVQERKKDVRIPQRLGGLITSLCIDKYNNVWVGKEDGLVRFNLLSGDIASFTSNPLDEQSLSHSSILSLYYDNQEVLWIGTYSGGVNKYDKNQFAFSKHKIYNSENPNLNSKIITAFEEDASGNIWIGTDGGGLFLWDKNKNSFTAFNPCSKNNYFPSYFVLTLKLSESGEHMWIGTYDQGLIEFTIKTKNSRLFNRKNNKLRSDAVFAVMEDRNKNIWVGTNGGGVTILNKENGKFENIDVEPTAAIRALCEDSVGNVWIGTFYGILIYHPNTKKVSAINPYNSNLDEIIYSIFRDSKNNMWLGTMGGGLHLFNPLNKKFTVFSEAEGLSNNIVNSIVEDTRGHLWITTYEGISRFTPKDHTFKNYTSEDGLQANRFNRGAGYRTKKGNILVGGIDGFDIFYPEDISRNDFIPPVVITDFQLYNKSVSAELYTPQELNNHAVPQITLPYNQSVFSIEFSALNFTVPEKNQYAYMLEGFDKDWNQVGNEHKATYTNLSPGRYMFRVMASNNDGVWNKQGTSLEIIITPPFWKTSYAYALYIVIALCLLYYIYREIKARERLKNEIIYQKFVAEKIEELNQLKLNFFTNISHELRTPLSLIIDPLRKIINEEVPTTPEAKKLNFLAFKNAARLSSLVSQLLDFRKFSGKHKLNPEYIDVAEFIKEICQNFEQRAEKRSIEFNVSINFSFRKAWIDTDKLEKILINLISNAFKFTPDKGKIEVDVTSPIYGDTKKLLEIIVKDNGPGISEADKQKIFDLFFKVESIPRYDMESSGIGLSLAKELVLIYGGEIYETGKEGEGAVFVVKLPLKEHGPEPDETNDKDEIQKDALFTHELNGTTEFPNDLTDRPIVLIVEDNPELREYIAESVLLDYHVVQASSGREGFEKALSFIPDLIISDIMMPDGNGLELCEKLRDNEKTSHIPVILLTAKQTDDNKIEGYRKGADAYVSKPFNSVLLTIQVENLIESRKKLRALFSKTENKHPAEAELADLDKEFLRKAEQLILENLLNDGFDVESFASAFAMNRKQLSRKLKALTNHTPHEYIVMVRLNRAVQLLITSNFNISEVAYQVGFSEPTNFSRTFTKVYGKSPREYISEIVKKPK